MKQLKTLILAISLATTPLLFSGCAQEPQVVYVTSDCPELQNYRVETKEHAPLKIDYKIKETK